MKILHIAEPFATGVLSFLMDITKRQADNHEVYIAYGIRPLTPSNVETLFDKRIQLIKVDSFKGALGTVVNPKAYLDVYRLYNQIKPALYICTLPLRDSSGVGQFLATRQESFIRLMDFHF